MTLTDDDLKYNAGSPWPIQALSEMFVFGSGQTQGGGEVKTVEELAGVIGDLFDKYEVLLSADMYDEIYQLVKAFAEERVADAVEEERNYSSLALERMREAARAEALEEYRRECVQCSYQAERVGNFEGHLCPHLKQAYERGLEEALGKCSIHDVSRGPLCSVCVVEASRNIALESAAKIIIGHECSIAAGAEVCNCDIEIAERIRALKGK